MKPPLNRYVTIPYLLTHLIAIIHVLIEGIKYPQMPAMQFSTLQDWLEEVNVQEEHPPGHSKDMQRNMGQDFPVETASGGHKGGFHSEESFRGRAFIRGG
ncbi:hypothetical protein TNIN_301521 [Trichonephila inaurata madagascariensis]|uniref:Uncharacterized protein n=1 Tax=Trichonephila inaurata madagascariensis TaxID=2747483 RepID=A0A8X6XV62_9ARAC|nr:hypothetical protein TNIN_301521 [Trichonephila inaurata madagascariensis]